MQVRDLRREPPRRWNVEIDGIAWLPRLIDKARAALSGTLGAYLFGQSPIDRECLAALGIGHRAFAQMVAEAPDDRAVLDAIAQRDRDAAERARLWSAQLPQRHGTFLGMLDLDDGYADGAARALKPAANALSFVVTWALKRLFPSRAIEGLKRQW